MRVAMCVVVLWGAPLAAGEKPEPLAALDVKAKGITALPPAHAEVFPTAAVFASADELAKSQQFDKVAVEKLKEVVNFEKARLVVFTWKGSGADALGGFLVVVKKKRLAMFRFRRDSGRPGDVEQAQTMLFVVPRDVELLPSPLGASNAERFEVREISTDGLKITLPASSRLSTPEVVTSAEALAKSRTLKGAADSLAKEVNFEEENVVFVSWRGSSADRLSPRVTLTDDALTFSCRVDPGLRADLYTHGRVFVVPKTIQVDGAGK